MENLRIVKDGHGIDLVCDRGHVAHMTAGYGQTQAQDATDIVRAVNCHADLLAALELSKRNVNALLYKLPVDASEEKDILSAWIGHINAAILKAKGAL